MAEEKKVTDFHEGDRVEFKCRGVVSKVTPLSVHVRLADLNDIVEMPVPPRMLKNLSEARQMTLEEAMELDVDDELGRVLINRDWEAAVGQRPFCSQKRTFVSASVTSALCHKQTLTDT